MDILYYLHNFPILSQSFVMNEIYEMQRLGHNILVFALNEPDQDISHTEFHEFSGNVHYANPITRSNLLKSAATLLFNPNIPLTTLVKIHPRTMIYHNLRAKQCIDLLENNNLNVDIVHSHFATLSRLPAKYVASHFGVPFTVTAHAYEIYRDQNESKLPLLTKSVDRMITISEYNKKYIHENLSDEVPITVVHAGIRPEKFQPKQVRVDNRILTVSRLIEKKGLRWAIEAISEIIEGIPDVEYHIVGKGPLESDLKNIASKNGIQDNVEFLGHVSDDRLITELDEAEAFLLPCIIADSGDRDGIPVALMEAMAMETPPISSNISGITELVDDGVNGYLNEPKDAQNIAASIKRLLSDKTKNRKMGKNGRKKVSTEFNSKKEAQKLERVFRDLI